MSRLKIIVPVFGILLLILSVASIYVAMQGLSEIRPAESYEDQGVRAFVPYDVLPVQVKNTGAAGCDRRMDPTKTVYMVYYRATDGSGYQWSDEVPSRDYGQRIVKAGETVKRRVLSIPEDGTYITVEPGQTAGSYTAGLRNRYAGIAVIGTLYVLFYIIVWLILRILRRLRRNRAEDAELDRAAVSAHASFSGPEIVEEKRRFRPGIALLFILPLVLLLTFFWAIGHDSKKAVDLDFGWNENVWTCRELDLRFILPAGGEIYDAEQHDEERREKFGSRGSVGRTLLTVIDISENSALGLLAIPDRFSESFVLKMVTAYAESLGGEYDLEAQEALTVGGYSWQTWRIELPEQGRAHYYLYRQNEEYSLVLTASGPLAETPPAILTCFDGENTVPVPPANAYLPPVNGEGHCVFDVPPSLLGNKTPEELVEEWQADLEGAAPEDMDRLAWIDLQANGSGGVSYVCTPEQYQRMKRAYYFQGTRILPPIFGFDPGEIIKRISYDEVDEEGTPWAVNVWIDRSAFRSGGLFSDFIANFVPMTMIGRYQIMCGVPADEWAVHVRLLDAETDAVLFEEDLSAEAG